MGRLWSVGCAALLLALASFSVRAANDINEGKPVILRDGKDAYPLGRFLDFLEDPKGTLTIEEITSPEYARQFIQSQKTALNFGYTDAIIWIRVPILNTSVRHDEWRLELEFANMQHISLYRPHANPPGFEVRHTGSLHPFATRDIPYHRIVFIVLLPPGEQDTLYLRLQSEAAIPVELTLWTPEEFTRTSQHRLLVEGLFLGTLLIMIGYNLIIGLFTKDVNYLYYVLFLLSALMYRLSVDGLGSQYLWPALPGINRYAVLISGLLILFLAQLFTIGFLETKRQIPRFHRGLAWFLIAWGAVACQLPFARYGVVIRQMNLLAPVGFVLLFIAGIAAWLKGYRPARYYVLAWSVLWIGVLLIVLSYTKLLPFLDVTQYGFQIGMVLVVWLLSLALADRINLYRREKEQAQRLALQTSQQNERLVREQNLRLEQTVADRTVELFRAKETAEEAQRTAEAAQRASETANRAKSIFLANMSHELRTPLNAILGFSQLMARDTTLSKTQRENLSIINHSGEHLLMLINDILEMSRIEAGQTGIHLSPLDLDRTLNTIEEMLRLRAEQKGIELIVERASDLPRYIRADESKLRQVLINLLSNAVKFTEQGRVTLKILDLGVEILDLEDIESPLSRQQSKIKNLKFEISDTGIGIAPDELDRIFDPFVQADDPQKAAEGTGLGLAISRQFVRLMGGEFAVASQPGEGSVFTFTLAVEVVEEAQAVQQQALRRVIGLVPDQHAPDGGPYRILIVEDQEFSRLLLRQLLETMDSDAQQNPLSIFKIRTAVNGQEAVEVVRDWWPHLIFMDIRMPIMDGYAATRAIRRAEEQDTLQSKIKNLKSKIPIIALTASAFEEDRQKVMAAGCNGFVRKPFQDAEIFDTLATHLGVQFVYDAESREQEAGNRKQGTGKNGLTPEMLAALPPDVLNALEQAAAQVNVKHVDAAIASIRQHDAPLADALASLARDFKYQEIWKTIQKGKHHELDSRR